MKPRTIDPDHITEKVLPGKNVRSLTWSKNELIDWVAGGSRYRLDGSAFDSRICYAYRFDAAVASPNGQFAVIYERLGTKGLVLHEGKVLREINRSFYHADVYEYPICLWTDQKGQNPDSALSRIL